MPPKMETKVTALEEKIATLEVSLQEMQKSNKENQEKILSEMQKSNKENQEKIMSLLNLSKEKNVAESSHKNESVGQKKNNSDLHGDALDEFRLSVKKVELPMFDGDDPAGWIARAEVYFRVQDTRPEIKVNLAQLCMDGATIHFFKGLLEENENLTWENLKDALLERYGGVSDGNIFEQLSSLQQEGTVEEYIEDFERLISQIHRLPHDQYVGYFVHGLKESIRGKVRSLIALGSVSRPKLMNVARAIERENGEGEKSWVARKTVGSQTRPGSVTAGNRSSVGSESRNSEWVFVKDNKEVRERSAGGIERNLGGNQWRGATGRDKTGTIQRDKGVRNLSSQEIAERRQKGLCFKCGGPFHPRHQCPDRNLRVMVTEEELEEEHAMRVMNDGVADSGDDEIPFQLSVMSSKSQP